MKGPSPRELRRDQALYRRLKHHLTANERSWLFERCRESYKAYQARLLELNKRHILERFQPLADLKDDDG